MISGEDKKDVARSFGKKAAGAVAKATNDAKGHALSKKAGSEYKKGFTKGDLAKHKKENFKIRMGWKDGLDYNPRHQ